MIYKWHVTIVKHSDQFVKVMTTNNIWIFNLVFILFKWIFKMYFKSCVNEMFTFNVIFLIKFLMGEDGFRFHRSVVDKTRCVVGAE